MKTSACEGEIGFVGYAGGATSSLTDPAAAARFARETGVDAMAIAVGNVHLQQDHVGGIDEAALAAITRATGGTVPLVIHGGSGVPPDQRTRLARTTPIAKFNIGTELRQTFGTVLRQTLRDHPEEFDRLKILSATEAPMTAHARAILRSLG
jgi:fructose-bisphosphate aldolase, class II